MFADLDVKRALYNSLSSVRLVLMDIDGTLITGSEEALDNVVNQLRRLRARRIRFSIATGRTLIGAQAVLESFKTTHARLPLMVAYNGGVVAIPAPQSIIERNVIAPPLVSKVLTAISRLAEDVLIYTCDAKMDLSPIECVYSLNSQPVSPIDPNGMKVDRIDFEHAGQRDDVIAILGITASRTQAQEISEQLKQDMNELVRITTSGGRFVEIAALRTTKLSGMLKLCELLRIKTDTVMSIGDSYNDREMILGSGVGVAVANAPDEVKKAADYVCVRQGAEGVVEALRMLMDAQRFAQMIRRAKANE